MTDLNEKMKMLEMKINKLEREMKNSMVFQKDFSKLQVVNRPVRFNNLVYDKNGNIVTEINT